MDYENENGRFEGTYEHKLDQHSVDCGTCTVFVTSADTDSLRLEESRFDRDRSASPRPAKREDDNYRGRDRSASPHSRMDSR